MRIRIAREGVETVDRRQIDERALVWLEPVLPLRIVFPGWAGVGNEGAELIGTATDVARGEDGWLTAEVTTDRDLTGFAAQIDVDAAVMVEADGVVHTRTGRLRAVTMGKHPVWDGMVIESWPTR